MPSGPRLYSVLPIRRESFAWGLHAMSNPALSSWARNVAPSPTLAVDAKAKALKAAGKPHRYLEIKDMGHGLVTMEPSMIETQLVEIETYLNTECGPGGIGASR